MQLGENYTKKSVDFISRINRLYSQAPDMFGDNIIDPNGTMTAMSREEHRKRLQKLKPPVVFMACGPLSSDYCEFVNKTVHTLTNVPYKMNIHYVEHPKLQVEDRCCNHPSAEANKKEAEYAIEMINRYVPKWRTKSA